MLMLIAMGCADFQGTDFRQGWTEVECDVGTVDGDGRLYVDVDAERFGGPRPTYVAYTLPDSKIWNSGGVSRYEDGRYLLSLGIQPEDADACRFWIAE